MLIDYEVRYMICKHCSKNKKSGFMTLKHVLQQANLHIGHPIYHSTSFRNATSILEQGFHARAGGPGNDAYGDNSVCFTRNLCFSESGAFGGGDVIFVLDLNKLKNRFKSYSYDWHSTTKRDNVKSTNPKFFEYEERISRSPRTYKSIPKNVKDTQEPETVIPAKYIELIILKKESGSTSSSVSRMYKKFKDTKIFVLRTGTDKYSLIQDDVDILGIMDALSEKDINLLTKLLKNGVDPNGIAGQSPLHYAVDYNMPDIAEMLLKHGADPNNKGVAWDVSILETAIDKSIWDTSRVNMVDLLMEHGAAYQSVLNRFVKNERENALELLLERLGTRPYKTDDLVFMAAFKGYAGILKILVREYGAGYTKDALAEAASYGHIDSVRVMLYDWENIPQIELNRAIYNADHDGYADVVDLLASYGADRSVLQTKAPSTAAK